jgi:hypothetical protein
VIAEERPGRDPWDEVVVGLDRMAPPDPELGPRWFTGARLNFAENLLRFDDEHEALVSWNESGRRGALTYAELQESVRAVAAALRAQGIVAGDRVAGFMPNIPEAVIAMLATASLGAIWSSCSPDFGVKGVLDRFGQIEPRVLFTADGYRYAGKEIDSLGRVREIVQQIRSIERVVVVPYLHADPAGGGAEERDAVVRLCETKGQRPKAKPIAYSRFPIPDSRAFPLRPSALHHVLVRHHGAAEVHGPRRGRDADPAPEGAPASY